METRSLNSTAAPATISKLSRPICGPLTVKLLPAPFAKRETIEYSLSPNSCCHAARISGLTRTEPTFQSYDVFKPTDVRVESAFWLLNCRGAREPLSVKQSKPT